MKVWRRWVDATSATESATSIALFRIAIGLCVLLTIGSVVWADLVEVIWVDVQHGGVRNLSGNWLMKLPARLELWWSGETGFLAAFEHRTRPATVAWVWTLVLTAMLSGLGLVLGLGGRVIALLALVSTQALVDINGHAGGSYDQLLQNGLWLCVITPAFHSLSLSHKLRFGTWVNPTPVGAWARYLVAFQIILVYSSTGWQKLSAYWTPGGDFSALYYILQQPSWQHTDMRWLARVFPLTQLATAISWLWEVTGPVWLLALYFADTAQRPGRLRALMQRARVRWVYLGLGVFFHLMILATMNVGPFGPISLAFYPALVLPAELDRWLGLPRSA